MQAKLTAKILSAKRGNDGQTTIEFLSENGKVSTSNISAQDTILKGEISFKNYIARDIRLGTTLTITISDEEA